MNLDSFMSKVSNFQQTYDYPVDRDMHVNKPIPKPSIGGDIGSSAAAFGFLGGAAGVGLSTPFGRGVKGGLVGAAIGGTLGALNGVRIYRKNKYDYAHPDEVYKSRADHFDKVMLPGLRRDEEDYINAIKDNTRRYDSFNPDEAWDEEHAFELGRKHEAHKSIYNALSSMSPEERTKHYQGILTNFRAMHPEKRDDEYFSVIEDGEPPQFSKHASELQNKVSNLVRKTLFTGKVTGGTAALGAAGFTGFHLGRGVDVMKQASVEALIKRANDLSEGIKRDFAGKSAPYVDLRRGADGAYALKKGLSLKAKAGIAGAALAGAGAIAYAYNKGKQEPNQDTNQTKVAGGVAETVMKDHLGKNAPYVNMKGKSSINSTTAAALLAAGVVGSGAYAAYKTRLKGTDPEKVAGLLTQAANFVAKNKVTSGMVAGSALGAASAGDDNRIGGALAGGAAGSLGAMYGKNIAKGLGKVQHFAAKSAPAQNMMSPVGK